MKRLRALVTGIVLVSLCFLASPCFASATIDVNKTYTISGVKLLKLDSNLKQLKEINRKQQMQLAEQSQQIKLLNEKLERAEQSAKESEAALKKAEETSMKAQGSLTNVNQSLMKLSLNEKETRLRIKRQRNTWEAVSGGLVLYMAYKWLNDHR